MTVITPLACSTNPLSTDAIKRWLAVSQIPHTNSDSAVSNTSEYQQGEPHADGELRHQTFSSRKQ